VTTQQVPQVLSGWHTVAEVCKALGVSLNVIYHETDVALAHKALWVKHRLSPSLGSLCLHIDTDSSEYRQLAEKHGGLSTLASSESQASGATPLERITEDNTEFDDMMFCDPHVFFSPFLELETDPTLAWSALSAWLLNKGVLVFQNALVTDRDAKSWQWKWDDLPGQECERKADAILAALDARFARSIPMSQPEAAPALPFQQKRLHRFWRFGKG